MSLPHTVAFLGFGEFEHSALASYFRLAGKRTPCYEQVLTLTDADFLVADADHVPSVQLVAATERLAETVFIGSHAPPGASAWMARPIDPLHVVRELDAMVALAAARAPAAGASGGATTRSLTTESLALFDDGLPAAHKPDPAAAAAPPPRPARERRRHPRPSRALLVDDSDIALRFLETRVQPWGLKTDRASTSEQAVELLAKHSYDLVFLDVELGDASSLDGLELCQHIKHSPAAVNAQVVMVSAHHSELDRVRGALAGCDAYLAKPLDQLELERLLSRRGLKGPAAQTAAPATTPQ